MKESKNIERLFQERLKDLEMLPNPAVWDKIEQSIGTPKKSKKRFIWWFSGTIAAILLLSFMMFKEYNIDQKRVIASQKVILKNNDTIIVANVFPKKSTKAVDIEQKDLDAQIDRSLNNNSTKINQKKTANNSFISRIKKEKGNVFTKEIKTPNKELTSVKGQQISLNNNIEKNIILDLHTKEKQNLSEVINEQKTIITNKTKPWSIAPIISELFYNTFSNKSSINSSLDNANKNGENSTSFGLKIAYQISEKWRIQTGVHKIDLAQTTENVSLNSFSAGETIIPQLDNGTTNSIKTELRQSFSYIEVPVELNYLVYETNKLQFHIMGGVSSLFLRTNNLEIVGVNYNGKVENLNKINFSLNMGTTAEYHFSDKWFFNISPLLKIQTQTFNKNNNQPYILGASTGVNYKF